MDATLAEPGLMRMLLTVTVAFLAIALGMAVYALVARFRNHLRARRRRSLEERWKPRLWRVLAGDADPSELREAVRPPDRRFFLEFLVRYARRFQGPEQRLVTELAEPWLDHAVARLGSDDPARRAEAAETIAVLGMPALDDVVLEVLDDPSPLVALTAARALLAEERAERVESVLERMPRFRNWSGGYLAATLALAGAAGAPPLRARLADPEADPWIRRVCAEALRRVPDYDSRPVAREVLAGSDDLELLAAALRLAGAVGGAEEAAVVRRFLERPEGVLRIHAARALGSIGSPSDVGRLRPLLESSNRWVALAAARSIGALGGGRLLERRARRDDAVATIARRALSEEAA